MQITLEALIGFSITILITLIGAYWGLLSLVFKQFEQRIERQFQTIEDDAKEWSRIEKEFLHFKAELPNQYVRREDYIRSQTVIESKLDALALKIENWQLKGVAK